MIRMTKPRFMLFMPLLTVGGIASAQTQRAGLTLIFRGCTVEAQAVQIQGRALVDLQELARSTNGSLNFEKDHIVITMPGCDASRTPGDENAKSHFSRSFTRAGIEAMASIREWGGMLMITVQNGYPVGNTMAGNTIMAYQGRAADSVALAASMASTEADSRGLELLKNELNNVQTWTEMFMKARNSLSATNLSVSESAVKDDSEIQKLVHCGQFLAQMFSDGTFRDDSACH